MNRPHIGLLVLAGTAFVLSTDLTMINVALGPLQQDLHASLTELGWVVDGYSIAALMLAPSRPHRAQMGQQPIETGLKRLQQRDWGGLAAVHRLPSEDAIAQSPETHRGCIGKHQRQHDAWLGGRIKNGWGNPVDPRVCRRHHIPVMQYPAST